MYFKTTLKSCSYKKKSQKRDTYIKTIPTSVAKADRGTRGVSTALATEMLTSLGWQLTREGYCTCFYTLYVENSRVSSKMSSKFLDNKKTKNRRSAITIYIMNAFCRNTIKLNFAGSKRKIHKTYKYYEMANTSEHTD